MIPTPTAALLAALLLFGFAALHAALALGAPLAALAWGGQAETAKLPPRLQLGSTVLVPFILAMGVLLLVRGGWIYPELAREMAIACWAVFLFVVTQFFGALRSQSAKERRWMMPLYGLAAVLVGVVAFHAS